MSLDGYVAGPDPTLELPLGEGGSASTSGSSVSRASARRTAARAARPTATTRSSPSRSPRPAPSSWAGACSAAARARGAVDPNADGWWGDEPPFGIPVFILSHYAREAEREGRWHDVRLRHRRHRGGARAGARRRGRQGCPRSPAAARSRSSTCAPALLDEMQIHLVPVFLGSGVRLFDGIPPDDGRAGSGAGGRRSPRRHPSPLPVSSLGSGRLELELDWGSGSRDRGARASGEHARSPPRRCRARPRQRDDQRRLEAVEQIACGVPPRRCWR